jgi:pilus assembly protein Flp/PilA
MMELIRNEDGQGMVEYGLILGLIAIVVIAALTATGTSISSLFTLVHDRVSSTAGN